jgi:hypothetical protein
MDALMQVTGGDQQFEESTQLYGSALGGLPIEDAISTIMAGVLSQVNFPVSGSDGSHQERPFTFTPDQNSFRQLPLGQALVTLVLLLVTPVYIYAHRHKVDKEWQNGNLTLRYYQ